MSETANRVVEIIVDKLGRSPEQVTPEASFTTDLGADSLDTVELIMDFEKEFDIEIPEEDAQNIKTVKDAIDYIEAHQKAWLDIKSPFEAEHLISPLAVIRSMSASGIIF